MCLIKLRKKVMMVAKMTLKQQLFCDEYLIDLNATQAAIRAGYSKKYANTNASKLLQITTIKEYIAARMAEKESKLIADQDEVLKYLTSVMRGESQSSVVVVESNGDYCTKAREMQKSPDEKERLKAAEMLGKRYGLYTEKVEQQVDMELNIKIDYGDDEGGEE
jgi:phage terminase small subunit